MRREVAESECVEKFHCGGNPEDDINTTLEMLASDVEVDFEIETENVENHGSDDDDDDDAESGMEDGEY